MNVWDRVEMAAYLAGRPLEDEWLEALRAGTHGEKGCYYVRFLYHLAMAFQPGLAVELGTQWGITSLHLCAVGGQVVGVDDTVHGRLLRENPRDNFTFLNMHSLDAAAEIGEMGKIDLLFQDTRPEGWEAEWEAYRPLMADGGVWVCGDVTLHPSWDEVPGDKREYAGLRGARVLGVVLL